MDTDERVVLPPTDASFSVPGCPVVLKSPVHNTKSVMLLTPGKVSFTAHLPIEADAENIQDLLVLRDTKRWILVLLVRQTSHVEVPNADVEEGNDSFAFLDREFRVFYADAVACESPDFTILTDYMTRSIESPPAFTVSDQYMFVFRPNGMFVLGRSKHAPIPQFIETRYTSQQLERYYKRCKELKTWRCAEFIRYDVVDLRFRLGAIPVDVSRNFELITTYTPIKSHSESDPDADADTDVQSRAETKRDDEMWYIEGREFELLVKTLNEDCRLGERVDFNRESAPALLATNHLDFGTRQKRPRRASSLAAEGDVSTSASKTGISVKATKKARIDAKSAMTETPKPSRGQVRGRGPGKGLCSMTFFSTGRRLIQPKISSIFQVTPSRKSSRPDDQLQPPSSIPALKSRNRSEFLEETIIHIETDFADGQKRCDSVDAVQGSAESSEPAIIGTVGSPLLAFLNNLPPREERADKSLTELGFVAGEADGEDESPTTRSPSISRAIPQSQVSPPAPSKKSVTSGQSMPIEDLGITTDEETADVGKRRVSTDRQPEPSSPSQTKTSTAQQPVDAYELSDSDDEDLIAVPWIRSSQH